MADDTTCHGGELFREVINKHWGTLDQSYSYRDILERKKTSYEQNVTRHDEECYRQIKSKFDARRRLEEAQLIGTTDCSAGLRLVKLRQAR